MARQGEYLHLRTARLQPCGGLKAVEVRHRDVHDHDVGHQLLRTGYRHGSVVGFADHFHVWLAVDDQPESLTKRLSVFRQKDADLRHVVHILAGVSTAPAQDPQAFLLHLSDELRPMGDPATVQRRATELLCAWLGASCTRYVEIDGGDLIIGASSATG